MSQLTQMELRSHGTTSNAKLNNRSSDSNELKRSKTDSSINARKSSSIKQNKNVAGIKMVGTSNAASNTPKLSTAINARKLVSVSNTPLSSTKSTNGVRKSFVISSTQLSSIKSIRDEMNDIKQIVKNQRESNEKLLNQLRSEVDSKLNDIRNEMKSIQLERPANVLSVDCFMNMSASKCIAERVGPNIENFMSMMMAVGREFNAKINELHENNKKIEQTLADVLQNLCFQNDASEKISEYNSASQNAKCDSLQNAIECMQQQINKVELLSMQNEERISKINQQVHVLSAKFIDYNARVNNFIFDFNEKFGENIKISKIIDRDARKFLVRETASKQQTNGANTSSSRVGDAVNDSEHETRISDSKTALNRFVQPYDSSAYTKRIKVAMNDINGKDLCVVTNMLKTKFEAIIGNGIVSKMHISKYNMSDDVVVRMEVIVEFIMPLNYKYIDSFRFPVNWSFVIMNEGKYNRIISQNFNRINERTSSGNHSCHVFNGSTYF